MKARAHVPNPLIAELESARRSLQRALAPVPEHLWARSPGPTYSPIGWHLGHVASVQARWLLPGEALPFGALFDPDATAKPSRVRLPGAHELQHAEHVQVIATLCEKRLHRMPPRLHVGAAGRLELAGGKVLVGSADKARAYDNERPQHEVTLKPYWLDRAPVSAGEFARFIDAGGYRDSRHWTADGWEWRATRGVSGPIGFREQQPDAPVTCLSWYEADAYARWRGARLPEEHELESANVPSAGVWEWTGSWFAPYPGFRAYPYERYSVPWFGTHRVLRGGSWATSPELMRPTLRNWYDPGLREIPSGFRCAGGL